MNRGGPFEADRHPPERQDEAERQGLERSEAAKRTQRLAQALRRNLSRRKAFQLAQNRGRGGDAEE
jgi:hypothetical protein